MILLSKPFWNIIPFHSKRHWLCMFHSTGKRPVWERTLDLFIPKPRSLKLYMCVCVCVCIFIYTHIYTCICIYTYIHIYVYINTYIYIHTCICTCICICIYDQTHASFLRHRHTGVHQYLLLSPATDGVWHAMHASSHPTYFTAIALCPTHPDTLLPAPYGLSLIQPELEAHVRHF